MSELGTELAVLRDIAGRLEATGLAYMLTGSLAMSLYATPRMTRDIDLVVELTRQDASRLREALAGVYYVPANIEQATLKPGMFNLLHLASVVKVDVVVRKDEPFRQLEFARRRRADLGGFAVWVVSPEDLLLSKLVWARDGDSEQQRRDAVNLLGVSIDAAYVDEWAGRLGVRELLDSLRHA